MDTTEYPRLLICDSGDAGAILLKALGLKGKDWMSIGIGGALLGHRFSQIVVTTAGRGRDRLDATYLDHLLTKLVPGGTLIYPADGAIVIESVKAKEEPSAPDLGPWQQYGKSPTQMIDDRLKAAEHSLSMLRMSLGVQAATIREVVERLDAYDTKAANPLAQPETVGPDLDAMRDEAAETVHRTAWQEGGGGVLGVTEDAGAASIRDQIENGGSSDGRPRGM